MKSIFIDTHTKMLNIAVLDDLKVCSYVKREEKEHSTATLRTIDHCLKEASFSLNEIDRIYVVNGPGSFTGVRIGVTIAKTLAYTLKKELIPVSSLMCYALSTASDIIAPIINARRKAVFAMLIDANTNILLDEQYILIDELKEKIQVLACDPCYVSYDLFEELPSIKPDFDFARIIAYYQNKKSVNPHYVNPNYLKRTEAEENLMV